MMFRFNAASKFSIPGLDQLVQRVPPVVAQPTAEAAVFTLNWLSATGSAILVAAVIAVIISFTYLTAQVTGIGIIMSRFLGVNYLAGVLIGLGAVLFCSYLGGMRAITWTQVAQCIVLLIAYLTPVTILSFRSTGPLFSLLLLSCV